MRFGPEAGPNPSSDPEVRFFFSTGPEAGPWADGPVSGGLRPASGLSSPPRDSQVAFSRF